MKIFKISLTVASLVLIVLSLWYFNSTHWQSLDFVESLLTGSFALSTCFLVTTYRISLIGKTKIRFFSLMLAVLTLILLGLIQWDPAWIFPLWKVTLGAFLFLLTDTILQQLTFKGTISFFTKGLSIITATLVLAAILFNISNFHFYWYLNLFVGILSLSLLVHFLWPVKRS